MKKSLLLISAACALCSGAAWAHHSRAMFDQRKQVKLVGTVKDFQWTNPHCWIDVLVPDPSNPSAAPVAWGVETGAPVELMRKGWKPGSLHPGQSNDSDQSAARRPAWRTGSRRARP